MSTNGSNGPDHQFDPVAAASLAALNSTQRLGRSVRSQLNAPQPPGAEGALNQSRTLLQQASSAAPFNVLASGSPPALPGMGQQGGGPLGALPNPQQLLPGQGGQGSGPLGNLPNPQQLLPGMSGQGGLPFPTPNTGRSRRGGGGGSSGSSNGDSTSEDTGGRDREMSQSR